MDGNAVKRAKARIARMTQAAKDLTQELGLPQEATYDVLAMMYGEEPSSAAVSPRATQEDHAARSASDDAHLKNVIYQLSEGFIIEQGEEPVVAFRRLWNKLKTFPLETLGGELGYLSTASQGIGFIGGQRFQSLLSIISTISWATIHYPTLGKSDSEHIRAAIAKEAEARGCSRAVSYALAHYLQIHVPYSAS